MKLDEATLGQIADMVAARVAPAVAVKTPTIKDGERAVVVCTELRGVFFGYATDTIGDKIKLRSARNAFYWTGTKGVLGLGATGPGKGSKIGDRADIELSKISCVIECTPEAIKAWESEKWPS